MAAISANVFAAVKETKQLTGVININTATAAELMLLPGVGKGKADAIIAFRQTTPFKAIQDLTKVKGIGDKMFAKFQTYLTLDGPTTAKVVKAQPLGALQQPAQSAGVAVQRP
ncbi:MAG: helix-hairpin-helix domain-containing protein [Deltaproteobacteria bacterium]|nr:helix-hairpin-helix domain-containing protein [Deltaproteobacteria bacterium]MBI2975280.1 helix-hairpin-helix domain-containing protein [Deltaproteobacteria bacterium]